MPALPRKPQVLFVIALALCIGCSDQPNAMQTDHASGYRNIWAAQKTEALEVVAFEKAWVRYLKSSGYTDEQIAKNRRGLTDQQIRQIEEGICMRLRDDIKAYLKVYLSDGKHLLRSNDLEILDSPETIVARWREQCELAYGSRAILDYDLPPKLDETWADRNVSWFEAFMLDVAGKGLYGVYIDLRNGRMIDEIDNEYEVMANSLAEFFNEVAKHQEAGKVVSTWHQRADGNEADSESLLNSFILKVYEP